MASNVRALAGFLLFSAVATQRPPGPPYAPMDGSGRSPVAANYNAKGTWFMPLATPSYVDGISSMPTNTNARNISNIIFSSPPFRYNQQGVSAFTAAWGQFAAHDMVMTTGSPGGTNWTAGDTITVVVPTGDPDMDPDATGTVRLPFRRNTWDLSTGTSTSNPRRQINMQTGWIDASTVYGTDAMRTAELRTFFGGLLVADSVNGCPINRRCVDMASGPNSPCDQRLAGDPRANVAPGIFSLQGLFVLEHNWWARKFATDNPTWDDETLFQEARKRVVAEIQAITMNQYLTVVLGEPLGAYKGFNASVDPRVSGTFGVAAYRYGHSGIDSSYWCIKPDGSQCPAGNLLLREVYFDPSYLDWGTTIADIMRGMYVQLESAIDTSMVPDVRNKVEGLKKDLAAWDILRGRDFGVPTYVQARRQLGLSVPTQFTDISSNGLIARTLQYAYNNDISAVDLWVGGLAESAASGKFIGPTFRALIREQMQRLRDGDWYWYENKDNVVLLPNGQTKRYFTDAEITEISTTSLGKIIARNTDWANPPDNPFVTAGKFSFAAATTTTSVTGGTTTATTTGSTTSTTGGSASANAATTTTVTTTVARMTINSLIGLEWTPPAASDTSITLTIYFNGDGWLGMGLGTSGMIGSDIWMMKRTGTGAAGGEVLDTKAMSYVTPATDPQQDVTLVSCTKTGSRTAFVVRRNLNTNDANDAPITSGALNVIFAWDPSVTTYGYHGNNRIQTTINFLSPPASALVSITVGANGTTNDTGTFGAADLGDQEALQRAALLNSHGWHGVSMFLVWGILVPAGSLAVRFLKHRPSHQAFHKWAMLTAATITLPAAGGALAQSVNRPVSLAHAQLGMTIAGVLLAQVVFGAMIRNWLTEAKLPPWYWQYVKQVHRGLGWLMLIGGLANCSLGADMLIKNGKWVVFAYGAMLVLIVLILLGMDEYLGRARKGQPKLVTLDGDQGRRMSMSQSKFSLSMTELRANVRAGSKWVIMQGYIYDIGNFIKHHPGGAFLLERCIGHDVTQFFFGREQFDKHSRAYAHSERAHKLLRTMCVAALKADVVARSWADAPTLDDAECTDKWVVAKRTVIDPDSRRPVVKLELHHPSANAVPALDWQPASFGRHMIAKASVATIRQVVESSKDSSRGSREGGGSSSRSTFPRRSASVAPSREGLSPSYGTNHGAHSKGSITGNVPDHVKTAMNSWYARSRRYQSGGEMTPGGGNYFNGNSGPVTSMPLMSPAGFQPVLQQSGYAPQGYGVGGPQGPAGQYGPGPGGQTMARSRNGVRSESPGHHRSSMTLQPYTGGPGGPSADDVTSLDYAGGPASAGGYPGGFPGQRPGVRYQPPGDPLEDLKPSELVERPYSIVRGDNKPGLIMYIRRYPRGAMSPYMFGLREGDEVTLSGPKGLGLHLDNNAGGVVVGIYQGTCVVAAFDLLQYIYAFSKDRKRHVAAENAAQAGAIVALDPARKTQPMGATLATARHQQQQHMQFAAGGEAMIGVDITPASTSNFGRSQQGMSMGEGRMQRSRSPPSRGDSVSSEPPQRDSDGSYGGGAASQHQQGGPQGGARGNEDHDLHQLLFSMPEPVTQTRVPASMGGSGGPRPLRSSGGDPISSRAAGDEGHLVEEESAGETGGVDGGAARDRQTSIAGQVTSGGRPVWSSQVIGQSTGGRMGGHQHGAPTIEVPGSVTPNEYDEAEEGGAAGARFGVARSTSGLTRRAVGGGAPAQQPPSTRPALPPIRAPGKRPSSDVQGGIHASEYPISVSTTENDAASMSTAAPMMVPGVGHARSTVGEIGKPHLKLVLMVVAENENSVFELDWLRHMDSICEDFELHLNLKSVKDPYALADFPRVYSGRLDAKRLESLLPPMDLLTVSVCGTPQFQREISELYRSMGLPRSLLTVVS